MISELPDRVVPVTGGENGIGAGVVDAFRDAGAVVVSADLSATEVAPTALDERSWRVRLDVGDLSAIESALAEVESVVGGIDTVITAAARRPWTSPSRRPPAIGTATSTSMSPGE